MGIINTNDKYISLKRIYMSKKTMKLDEKERRIRLSCLLIQI